MKTQIYLALLCLSGCAGWPATREAGVRRTAQARLASCLKTVGRHVPDMNEVETCHRESRAFCLANGLEPTCGNYWSTP